MEDMRELFSACIKGEGGLTGIGSSKTHCDRGDSLVESMSLTSSSWSLDADDCITGEDFKDAGVWDEWEESWARPSSRDSMAEVRETMDPLVLNAG